MMSIIHCRFTSSRPRPLDVVTNNRQCLLAPLEIAVAKPVTMLKALAYGRG